MQDRGEKNHSHDPRVLNVLMTIICSWLYWLSTSSFITATFSPVRVCACSVVASQLHSILKSAVLPFLIGLVHAVL